MNVVKRWPEVHKISFVAHSLGGLVARYAIGRLYELLPRVETAGLSGNCLNGGDLKDSTQYLEQHFEARVAGLEPMNFITFATPHLGSRGHRQVWLCLHIRLSHFVLHISNIRFYSYWFSPRVNTCLCLYACVCVRLWQFLISLILVWWLDSWMWSLVMLINDNYSYLMTSGFSTTTNIRGKYLSMNLMSNYAAWMNFCIKTSFHFHLCSHHEEDVKLGSPSVWCSIIS